MLVEYNFYIPKGMDEQDAPPAGEENLEPTPTPGGDPTLTPPTDPTGAGAPATPEPTPGLPTAGTPTEPTPNAEGEVELDITDLINSTKDTKGKIDGINELLNNLMTKFDDFENKISSFDQILNRIDSLEKDFDKRMPTPVEKLEMRSMDSFPYSVKLSDFWKEENEEIGDEKHEQEHALTPEDIKKDYNASTIKTTFDIKNPEDQDFER